jgi:Cu-Zn family superoxide dismutase
MLVTAMALLAPAAQPAPSEDPPRRAEAVIEARSGSRIEGQAVFEVKDGRVTLELTVRNLPAGRHAVHLHEVGDCSDPEAKSAGAHWNPSGHAHGRWGEAPHHLGDIGNLEADDTGTARFTLTTDRWTLGGPVASDVVGKSVIIHVAADDFTTQPTGNAGGRIGCGVIKAAK